MTLTPSPQHDTLTRRWRAVDGQRIRRQQALDLTPYNIPNLHHANLTHLRC